MITINQFNKKKNQQLMVAFSSTPNLNLNMTKIIKTKEKLKK